MGIQLVIGSVFLGFASVILGEGMDINWTWSFATAALMLSIPATALMVVLWYALLASAPLNSLNSFTFLTPAIGVVIGLLWFGETFTVVEITGISITIIGLIIVMKAPGEGGRVREFVQELIEINSFSKLAEVFSLNSDFCDYLDLSLGFRSW